MLAQWPTGFMSAAVALASMLSACSTEPLNAAQSSAVPAHRIERPELLAVGAIDATKSRITFMRDDGSLQFGGGCGFNIHLDHRPLATLRNGESMSIDLPPGQYAVHFTLSFICPTFTSSTVTVTARAGVETKLRMGMRDGQPFLQPVAE